MRNLKFTVIYYIKDVDETRPNRLMDSKHYTGEGKVPHKRFDLRVSS